jgi:hypothetical protein
MLLLQLRWRLLPQPPPHLFLSESQLPELDQLPLDYQLPLGQLQLATISLVPRLKPKTGSSTMEPATG